jgi:hypothetical protein
MLGQRRRDQSGLASVVATTILGKRINFTDSQNRCNYRHFSVARPERGAFSASGEPPMTRRREPVSELGGGLRP